MSFRSAATGSMNNDRIVAEIEELFSELDKGVENLEKAREQLKVYRQAVLKHAFEGKLTAQWREENKDQLENPEQLLARIKQERSAHYDQRRARMECCSGRVARRRQTWKKTGETEEAAVSGRCFRRHEGPVATFAGRLAMGAFGKHL